MTFISNKQKYEMNKYETPAFKKVQWTGMKLPHTKNIRWSSMKLPHSKNAMHRYQNPSLPKFQIYFKWNEQVYKSLDTKIANRQLYPN